MINLEEAVEWAKNKPWFTFDGLRMRYGMAVAEAIIYRDDVEVSESTWGSYRYKFKESSNE